MDVDEEAGNPLLVSQVPTTAPPERPSPSDERPTSKVIDAAILIALGVLVALFALVTWMAFDLFAWPEAGLGIAVVVFLGAVPAAFAIGALVRWRVSRYGHAIARLSLGVLLAGFLLLVVYGSGVLHRLRFAASVGDMDSAAEALIARHDGAVTTVDAAGPISVGWLTMRSYQAMSCGPSGGDYRGAPPGNDPGVLFEDGLERRLLYCRNHSQSDFDLPDAVEASRDTAITHLGGNWYVITEGF